MFDWKEILEKLQGSFKDLLVNLAVIIAVFFAANLILKFISTLTGNSIKKARQLNDSERSKTIITSMTITRSIFKYVIYFVAIAFILNMLGYGSSVNSLLVTAGIGSLIISLGAQSIAQDFIAGVFLTFERPYAVGDYVKIGEYEGTVTAIAVKSTYLKAVNGQTIVIPNGQVKIIVNYSTDYNLININITTPLAISVDKAKEIIDKIIDEYYQQESESFLAKPEIKGIAAITVNTYDIVIAARVEPLHKIAVDNQLRLKIKQAYDKNKIY